MCNFVTMLGLKKFLFMTFIFWFLAFSYANLQISEVYFDWKTKEYVWIYNKSDKIFSGVLTLSGVKKSILKIETSILPLQEIIIGDDVNFSGVKCLTWQGLSISDTKALNIELYSGNNLEDTFKVEESQVKLADKNHWGFEKVFYSTWIEILTWTSPGKVKDYTLKSKINTSFKLSCSIVLSWDKLYYKSNFTPDEIIWDLSWNIFTGKSLDLSLIKKSVFVKWIFSGSSCQTLFLQNNNTKNNFIYPLSNYLYISEVYAKKDKYPEYIELTFIRSFSGNLSFLGLSRWSKKWSYSIIANTWDIWLISKEKIIANHNIVYPSISLADNWEDIEIFSGSEINSIKVNYPAFKKPNSYYPKFEKFSYPTPGSIFKNYDCKVVFQNFKDNKINLLANVSNKDICKSPYLPVWYVWNKVYTWTCNPSYFKVYNNLTGIKFEILDKNKNVLCEDNFYFFISTKANISSNSSSLKINEYNCYNLNSTQLKNLNQLILRKYSRSTLKRIYSPIKYIYLSWFYDNLTYGQIRQVIEKSLSKYSVNTLKRLYYPVKNLYIKTYPENWLKLKNLKTFSWYNQFIFTGNFSTGFYLILGKKKVYIKNLIFSGNNLIFKSKISFPNKWVCIKVKFKEKIYDEKCFLDWKLISVDDFYFLKKLNSTKYDVVFSWKNILLYANSKLIWTYKNKPLIKLYRLALKLFNKIQKNIKHKDRSIKKLNKLYISYLKKYVYYKWKYDKLKQKTNYDISLKKQQLKFLRIKLKKYKLEITTLKQQIRKIKRFIKQNTSYSLYKKLLNFIKLNG